jgi:hypothetical protein
VRSNKRSGLKLKAMLNLELKKGHFRRKIKLMLPLEKSSEKKVKKRTCYISHEKRHLLIRI